MAAEAQRLISISLTKMAQARAHRGGQSLHRNLLVTSVLHRARYVFVEEAYHMMEPRPYLASVPAPAPPPPPPQEELELVALTAEEAAEPTGSAACGRCEDGEVPTYLDLDKSSNAAKGVKRRRVGGWETEEALTSILPKRQRVPADSDADSDVFAEEGGSTMEVDRITSLVSIFSFGGLGGGESPKLTRSVSTPDLCSAQAKEGVDVIQQRPFLAMTV